MAANCHVPAILHLLADSFAGLELLRRFGDFLAAPDASAARAHGISMKTSAALLAHSPGLYLLGGAGVTRCLRQLVFLFGVDPGVSQNADDPRWRSSPAGVRFR